VALAYTALLLAARAFADPGIPFDSRLLSPLFLLAALLAAVSLGLCWPHLGAAGRAAAVAALLLWGAGAAGVFRDELADARANGTGYASRAWRTAPISRWLRGPARDYALFTNHPMIAYIQAGRASRELPDTLTPDVLADFRDVLRARHGAVVGFRDSYRPMVSPDTLAAKLGLVPLLRSAEGTVWAPPGGN
jgi:hypothetical protein